MISTCWCSELFYYICNVERLLKNKKFIYLMYVMCLAYLKYMLFFQYNRAVWGFCEFLKGSGNPGALQPYLPAILDGLVTLATQASSEVLSLILETCCIVVSVDSNFTAANVGRISTLCLAVFIKANNDPVLVALVQDVVRELCQNPGCITTLQTKFIPTLASILNASTDKVRLLKKKINFCS